MLPLAGVRGELLLLGIELARRRPPELAGLAILRTLTVLLLVSERGLLPVLLLVSERGLLPVGLPGPLRRSGPLLELALLGLLAELRLLWLLAVLGLLAVVGLLPVLWWLTLPGLLVQSSAGRGERVGAALGLCPTDRAGSCRALLVLVGLTR